MIRRPPRSTRVRSSAASDVYKRQRLFSARGNVITTATPTTDPNVLSLLDSPVTLSEREQNLLRLRVGGAIAILGDNFQIGAHIIVKDRNGDVSLSLLRLDEGPSWLAVVKQEGVQCWKVTESTSGPPLGSPATEGRATVSGPQGTKSDVPATYDVQATGSGVSSTVIIHLVAVSYTHLRAHETV